MKDTMAIFRSAVASLIEGNIIVDGNVVPVFDKKRRANVPSGLYVILGTQRESDAPQTSETFITDSELDIEIWHITDYEVSSAAIDSVSDQLLKLLMALPDADNMPVQNLFQISGVRRVSSVFQEFSIGPTDTVLNKNITIAATIVQQNP